MYSVLTYIFGSNEILRTPKIIDNIEYICVTDNKNLSSDIWTIHYDPLNQFTNNRLKFAYVKTHPFQYVHGNKCLVIDGSIEIISSVMPLFDKPGDLLMKLHPLRNTLQSELDVWEPRGLSKDAADRYKLMATLLGANLNNGPVYESCVSVWSNLQHVVNFGNATFNTMLKLSRRNDTFLSNQLVMSLLAQTVFKNLRINYIHQPDYFIKYMHNSLTPLERQY